MTNLYWLEQSETDVPAETNWLSERESEVLKKLRFAKRRADWLLGRWTAKHAVAMCHGLSDQRQSLAQAEVLATSSGAPAVFLAGLPADVAISISHSGGVAMCVVGPTTTAVGCDLEVVEPRDDAFVSDYFTAEEQALVARCSAAERPPLVTLLWSAKESTLKALQSGLRLDTRSINVTPSAFALTQAGWLPLQASYNHHLVFNGWWQRAGDFVRTLVSAPPPNLPHRLDPRPSEDGCSSSQTTIRPVFHSLSVANGIQTKDQLVGDMNYGNRRTNSRFARRS